MLRRMRTEWPLRLGARAIAILGVFSAMYGVGNVSLFGTAAGV